MTRRYVLAPEAALDLVQIWRYIKEGKVLKSRIALSQRFWTKSLSSRRIPVLDTGVRI
jgi:hypothetical protein